MRASIAWFRYCRNLLLASRANKNGASSISFAPSELVDLPLSRPHSLRCGLHSIAASRLGAAPFPKLLLTERAKKEAAHLCAPPLWLCTLPQVLTKVF
jgi:hypothetical protein